MFKSTLKRGSSGSEVKQLQVKLQALGFLSTDITPNGNFGYATQKAVQAFQSANDLSSVGFVGQPHVPP